MLRQVLCINFVNLNTKSELLRCDASLGALTMELELEAVEEFRCNQYGPAQNSQNIGLPNIGFSIVLSICTVQVPTVYKYGTFMRYSII